MKKSAVLKGMVGLLLLFPLYSQAITLSGYLEVKQLIAKENTSEAFKSTTQAYLNGVANGFNFYAVSIKLHNQHNDFKPLYCPPSKVVQNADFMVKHLDAYLDKYPQIKKKQSDMPVELIYVSALQDAYPCK